MTELETYDTELAHNMWHDNHRVWIACDPDKPSDLEAITEAHQIVDADGLLFVIEI
jgi:hypothetical protein